MSLNETRCEYIGACHDSVNSEDETGNTYNSQGPDSLGMSEDEEEVYQD